jgi:sugar/nucleoside kinase (ribokinase family)
MTKKTARTGRSGQPLAVGTGLVALDAVTSADPSVPVRHWAGGTCGNVLIALRYLGWKAQPIARLANDRATELLLSDLRRWGVSERFVRVEDDGSTPIIVHRIAKDAKGRVTHSFSWRCMSCGARYPGYKPELLTVAESLAPKLKHVSVFFFDRVSAAAIALAKSAAQTGALVVFEPSGIGNPILFGQAWEIAHVVKYSHERLSDFPEIDVEANPRLLIETLGDAGLRYRWRSHGKRLGTWVESKALSVEGVRDTAGSGDWCTAGLLSKVAATGFAGFSKASDEQIAEAIRFGQALAAWNCQFEGARGGMYAVSKKQFQQQIKELLSGSGKVIPVNAEVSLKSLDASGVCKVCEHSTSGVRAKHRRAT